MSKAAPFGALFLLCVLVEGCALPRTMLNPPTKDIADHFNELIDSQVDSNARRIARNPEETPSYITITSGTFQNTDSITPNVGLPLGKSHETDVNPSTKTTKVTQSTEVDTVDASNVLKQVRAAPSFGLSAMAQWQQSWTATPLIDPDAIRRQKEIYRYFAGWDKAEEFFERYPIQKAPNSGINILLVTTLDEPNVVQYDVDPTYLRRPSCVLCTVGEGQNVTVPCDRKSINSIEEAQEEARDNAQAKIAFRSQQLSTVDSGSDSDLDKDNAEDTINDINQVVEKITNKTSDNMAVANLSAEVCVLVEVNERLPHKEIWDGKFDNGNWKYQALSGANKISPRSTSAQYKLEVVKPAEDIYYKIPRNCDHTGYACRYGAFGELVPFILEAASTGNAPAPNSSGNGNGPAKNAGTTQKTPNQGPALVINANNP